jgi:hypothetical protein
MPVTSQPLCRIVKLIVSHDSGMKHGVQARHAIEQG